MTAEASNVSAPDLVGWTAGPDTRGTLTLVWSCLITIFACTWTVLHLNVPGRDEGSFTILLRKTKWMAINILFPEFIFAKAVCDLRLALEELREFDNNVRDNEQILSKWTTQSKYGLDWPTHEWSWQFEYPPLTYWLYRVLHLEPPRQPFNQKPLFHVKTDSPNNQSNMDAQLQFISNGNNLSNTKTGSSSLKQANNPQKDADAITPDVNADMEAGQLRTPRETPRVQWRTVQKWTVVHSYYAQMGGMLYPSLEKSWNASSIRYFCCTASMLTPRYEFGSESKHRLFCRLILSEEDIRDKSKADWVLKAIAVAQVSWLILSVTVRSIRDLPITQLEIATISFAVMAILSYAVNWWKPKDISHASILLTPASGSTKTSDQPQAYTQSFKTRLLSPISAAQEAKDVNDKLERVPNDLVWMEGDSPLIFIIMAVSSLVFGSLHCIAWYFQFPSEAELLCWRVASLISAALPAISLGISLALHFLATTYPNFQLVSILLRKFQPLPSEILEYLIHPEWESWSPQAKVFLFRTSTGLRDWETERPTATRAHQANFKSSGNSGSYFGEFGSQLSRFLKTLEKARGLTPYDARILRDKWVYIGSWMQASSKGNGVLEFWQDYENFVKRKHNIPAPDIPDSSCVAFVIRAYTEAIEEYRRWGRLRKICEEASLILTVCSGLIYTIARLVILVLLFYLPQRDTSRCLPGNTLGQLPAELLLNKTFCS